DGKLTTLSDIYGHDKRIAKALAGESLTVIAASDPARAQKREMERLAKSGASYAMAASEDYEFSDYYGYSGSGSSKKKGNSWGGGGFFLFSSGYDSEPSYYDEAPKRKKKAQQPKKGSHTWSLTPYAH